MDNKEISNPYVTSDLGLATALSLQFPIWAIDKRNPQKVEFVFERDLDLDNRIESYWTNHLSVSALSYFQQLKIVKSRIYEK